MSAGRVICRRHLKPGLPRFLRKWNKAPVTLGRRDATRVPIGIDLQFRRYVLHGRRGIFGRDSVVGTVDFATRMLAAKMVPLRHVGQTMKALVGIAIAEATLPAWMRRPRTAGRTAGTDERAAARRVTPSRRRDLDPHRRKETQAAAQALTLQLRRLGHARRPGRQLPLHRHRRERSEKYGRLPCCHPFSADGR